MEADWVKGEKVGKVVAMEMVAEMGMGDAVVVVLEVAGG